MFQRPATQLLALAIRNAIQRRCQSVISSPPTHKISTAENLFLGGDTYVRTHSNTCNYFFSDCPEQEELYTNHVSMSKIFEKLDKLGYHLVKMNLIDSHYCSEPAKFVVTLLLALNMMLRMFLPHVNVLSKVDLLKRHKEKLHFNLDFYTDVLDLKYLLEALENNKK